MGCGSSPAPRDASGDGLIPTEDADNDGVCNGTEVMRETDPTAYDSDEDGYSDYAELFLGFDPNDPSSPSPDMVFLLREDESSTLQIPVMQDITGAGQDYSGAFETLSLPDGAEETAATFHVESLATFATPPENVSVVDAVGQSFQGVVGRTLVGFELRFAFGATTPRVCARGHRFRYNIKRSDGELISAPNFVLLVLEPGKTLATSQWCLPLGGCI